ncbi:hypothetical protein PTKIN_Ptkin04bG0128100 [Pterospermum kingtungense]
MIKCFVGKRLMYLFDPMAHAFPVFSRSTAEELHVLHRLSIAVISRKPPVLILVIWVLPSLGWIKLNTDGAARSSPSLTSAGGAF